MIVVWHAPSFPLRETMAVHPRLLSIPELSHHLAESFLTCSLYIQEMMQYKRQNHGKVSNVHSSTHVLCEPSGNPFLNFGLWLSLSSVILWQTCTPHAFSPLWFHNPVVQRSVDVSVSLSLPQFCVMMCSGSFVLAVVGHYIPGIMISYIIGKLTHNIFQ